MSDPRKAPMTETATPTDDAPTTTDAPASTDGPSTNGTADAPSPSPCRSTRITCTRPCR